MAELNELRSAVGNPDRLGVALAKWLAGGSSGTASLAWRFEHLQHGKIVDAICALEG